MRLWHKELLSCLPRQQMLSQLRECVAIAKDIHEKGTTNHILINKIMDYPIEHFQLYCDMVVDEMESRDYNVSSKTKDKLSKYLGYVCCLPFCDADDKVNMFKDWHNDRYFIQCFHNLEEKYDCGGINDDEWYVVLNGVSKWNEKRLRNGKDGRYYQVS